jgi:hypothetical protein
MATGPVARNIEDFADYADGYFGGRISVQSNSRLILMHTFRLGDDRKLARPSDRCCHKKTRTLPKSRCRIALSQNGKSLESKSDSH